MAVSLIRFLWVSNHTPFLVDFGGGQRSSLLYRTLRPIGEVDVLLVCAPRGSNQTVKETHGEPDGRMEIVEPLKRGQLLPWRHVRFCAPAIVDRIAYNLGARRLDYARDPKVGAVFDRMLEQYRYNLIIGRHLKYPAKAGALGYAPIIIDVDDCEMELYRSLLADSRTSTLRRAVLRHRLTTLERIVPPLMRQSTYLWVSKEEDRSIPGCEEASVLPNLPYEVSLPNRPSACPPDEQSKIVLFVGMLSYVHNVRGIDSFLKEAWPVVRQAVPDAVLRLVGSRLTAPDRARWSAIPGVEVVGFVPELRDAYQRCAFAIMPIWCGAGTNIKVSEALMYGRTCVVSRFAHRGYTTTFGDGECVLVSTNTQEMARHCIELLRNPERRARLAATGARVAASTYSYGSFQKIVVNTVEAALRRYHRLCRK